jgi:dipeptidyl-peptidase-4
MSGTKGIRMKKDFYKFLGRSIILSGLLCIAFQFVLSQQRSKEFTLEDLFTGSKFYGKAMKGFQWYDGGKSYTYLETDTTAHLTNIWKYDIGSGKKTKFVDGGDLVVKKGDPVFSIENYTWSPAGKKVLFTGSLTARRLKTGGNFFLYDLADHRFVQLTNSDQDQMNVKFSPDGRKIGFVRANNLFVQNLEDGKETQLTFDGSEHVLNGHFDWVYEEEFGIIDGWQWSPDGKYIAYWQIDETREPEFPVVNFIPLQQEITRVRYPKAGDRNPVVKIGILNLPDGKNIWADIGAPLDSTQDTYIPRIQWTERSHRLCVERLNRHQNTLDVSLVDPASGKATIILTETSSTWVDVKDDLTFLKNSDQFIWSSERDGYNHLYLYDVKGTLVRQLTQGHWDVDHVLAVDEHSEKIYFNAGVTSPINREVYSIGLDGSGFKRITKVDGTNDAKFSPDCSVFLHTFSDANTPTSTSLRKNDGSLIRVIDDGHIGALDDYTLIPQTFFTFKTSDGVELNAWMIKPAGFDPSKKYPVVMNVYGGPGSQQVVNAWGGLRLLWYQLLAQHGYIVACVDNRGTGARGYEFKTVTYKHLGKWETHDQIECAKYLASLPFVDGTRIGILGASYGGYMTLMSLLLGNDVFKAGIASSSVTHWKFYDSIYTERYMLTPEENPDGYAESAPLSYAKNLKGNLLIIHGTDDDNVHLQNTISMINELVKENKLFETALYPGSRHGIRQRLQYYMSMTNFIFEKL